MRKAVAIFKGSVDCRAKYKSTGTYLSICLFLESSLYSTIMYLNLYTIIGVWLLCPLADCPPDGWSSMDEPLYILSRQRIVHSYYSSPACKRHPTD